MGFEFGDRTLLPFTRLFQQRQPLERPKCSRLTIERSDRALSPYIFQNCVAAHRRISTRIDWQ